jgi:hypothetical protein
MSWTASDEDFSPDPHEILRARPLGSLAAAMMGVAAIVVLAAALLFTRSTPTQEAEISAAAPALAQSAPASTKSSSIDAEIFAPTPSGLSVVGKRAPVFDIDSIDLATEKKSHAVRDDGKGEGRQETLSVGAFEDGKLFLRFDFRRLAGEKLVNSDFYLDMARRAAQAGLAVKRIGPPSPISTRFGPFEAAEIRLSQTGEGGAPSGAAERGCLAVRMSSVKAPVEIAGLACGAAAKPIDRRVMSCLLDRLRYVPSGEDKALERLFAGAEPERPQGCFAAAAPSVVPNGTGAKSTKKPAAARR